MIIQVDTREKEDVIKGILQEFDNQGVKHFRSKLPVGDYVDYHNPRIIIDRKHNIGEVAQNCTSGHKRFRAELERLKDLGAFMYILVEQNRIGNKPIKSIEDVMLWKNPHGMVNGMQIYKIMYAWEYKYPIKWVFCSRKQTGKEIIRLLKEADNGKE